MVLETNMVLYDFLKQIYKGTLHRRKMSLGSGW